MNRFQSTWTLPTNGITYFPGVFESVLERCPRCYGRPALVFGVLLDKDSGPPHVHVIGTWRSEDWAFARDSSELDANEEAGSCKSKINRDAES